MSDVLEKAILAEVEPGKHYFIAIKRGSVSSIGWRSFADSFKDKGFNLHILETYENPADCLLFNARKEETVIA